jgi:threonine dehydrogenase-like Zn-dependent dehydrogenase
VAERAARVAELTGGHGADAVFDFAGAPGVVAEAIGFAATRATVVVVGTTDTTSAPVALSTIMRKELHVVGSINGDIADIIGALEVFDTFRDRVPWDRMFSPARPLDQIVEAIEAMARHEVVKSVIDPQACA